MDLTPIYTALTALIVGLLTGLGGYITARLKKATTKEEVEEIKLKQQTLEKDIEKVQIQASLKHYYTKCNKCGNEIDLSTAEIYTKEDENDNN